MKTTKVTRRHVPQRTCLGCRQVRPKQGLTRLVCADNGGVEIDYGDKNSKRGRGAYLCQNLECWEAGIKSRRLEYALRATLTTEKRDELLRQGKDLLGETKGGNSR